MLWSPELNHMTGGWSRKGLVTELPDLCTDAQVGIHFDANTGVSEVSVSLTMVLAQAQLGLLFPFMNGFSGGPDAHRSNHMSNSRAVSIPEVVSSL